MKRILKIFYVLIIVLLMFLSGCSYNNNHHLKKALDETINNFSQTYDLENITDDLQFIEIDKYGNYYLWNSSNEYVISNTGKVNRHLYDVDITLTVKIYENKDFDGIFYQATINCIVLKIDADGHTYDLKNVKSFLSIYDLNEVEENECYVNYLDVIAYIYYYKKLPNNYLTKNEAQKLGWSGSGNVWVNNSLKNKNIGGDTFKNYEQLLPIVDKNTYIEVDVNCKDGIRGKYRLVYNRYTFDIYYTDDHYNSFTYMIGELK